MPTATALRPGTIISVRAYFKTYSAGGAEVHQTGYRDAIVVGDLLDRPMLWFPSFGAPEAEFAIQPLYGDMDYRETGKDVPALSAHRLKQLRGQLNRDFYNLVGAVQLRALHTLVIHSINAKRDAP